MITGVSGGLAQAAATSVSAQGWHLALVGRDASALDRIDAAANTNLTEAGAPSVAGKVSGSSERRRAQHSNHSLLWPSNGLFHVSTAA